MTIEELVSEIAASGFAHPPAPEPLIDRAKARGIPEAILDLYRCANGLYVVDGSFFPAPDGRRYRFMVPKIEDIHSVAEYGFASDESPLVNRMKNWWQFFDCGDGNWVGMTDGDDGFRIVDLFHETI